MTHSSVKGTELGGDYVNDICDRCGKPIADDEMKAYGPGNKVLHYRCFKVGKMHGREVTLQCCLNCGGPIFRDGEACYQCGVSPRVG